MPMPQASTAHIRAVLVNSRSAWNCPAFRHAGQIVVVRKSWLRYARFLSITGRADAPGGCLQSVFSMPLHVITLDGLKATCFAIATHIIVRDGTVQKDIIVLWHYDLCLCRVSVLQYEQESIWWCTALVLCYTSHARHVTHASLCSVWYMSWHHVRSATSSATSPPKHLAFGGDNSCKHKSKRGTGQSRFIAM
jgi:hypothetical protein